MRSRSLALIACFVLATLIWTPGFWAWDGTRYFYTPGSWGPVPATRKATPRPTSPYRTPPPAAHVKRKP